VGLNILPWK